eukprot:CAMPEP_0181381238 /NCGR_PEP_ID=MMETSP1106-20121128/20010_1 /TAXON_ID=81844 /ORGANISM="Mantoniella antarctica, Strain SL-175" /LENGTH=285 /DNA_ID=CAMNT_0023500399 /DNA_START=25 /DNA_END=878 /DNA_ORIENTATION=-
MTSAAGAAREREKLRQAELETERLREAVATLEVQLRHASSTHAKDLAAARAQLGAANERASHAQTRAVALEEALAHSSSSPRPKQSDKRAAIGGGRSRPGGGAGVLAACAPLAGAAENGMSPNPLFQMAPPMSPLRPVTCMGGNADMSSISRHAVGDGGGCGDMPRYDGPTTTPACTSGGGHAHASSRGRDAQNSDGWDHRGGELERHDPDQELEFEHHAHTAVGGGQRRGAVAVAVELATWQDPGRSAKLLGGGLYVMLCVSSLRSMPLPLSALACYGVIAALA